VVCIPPPGSIAQSLMLKDWKFNVIMGVCRAGKLHMLLSSVCPIPVMVHYSDNLTALFGMDILFL